MGTVPHHQSKAHEFLHRADRLMPAETPADAATALRRAASHITTALAVHYHCKHNSIRRLETALHVAIVNDALSRSHVKTFRHAHTLSQRLQPSHPAHPEPVEGRPTAGQPNPNPKSNHPIHPVHPCKITLRRLRRRVASLIKAANNLISGQANPSARQQRSRPAPPDFTCAQDIIRLPNFDDIRDRFGLRSVGLAAAPDPHDCYARGEIPRPCQCHAALWNRPQDPNRITLSPLWQKALEKTFHIRLPNLLQLPC